jgi:hypothetical protein
MRCNDVKPPAVPTGGTLSRRPRNGDGQGEGHNDVTGKHAKWWSLRDIARRWGVSLRTVQRRVETGELEVVKISERARRVRPAELRRYEHDHEIRADGDAA